MIAYSASQSIAFFCSQSCPGDVILKLQDWANEQTRASAPVISGFHTAIERDVLRILLRNKAPLFYCLARTLEGARLPAAVRVAHQTGFAQIISPFPTTQKRTTAASAEKRNRHILTLTKKVLFAHASKNGKTERLAKTAIREGATIFTLPSLHNSNLLGMGAQVLTI
jgi:predicted Rossmann fold nucleotide-binding protein DprA/Smf involved in DNA uptake